MSDFHTPVMVTEVIDNLKIKKDSWYVDCNLGGGGHTKEILLNGGKALGVDMDAEAIFEVTQKLGSHIKSGDLVLYQSNFVNLTNIVSELGIKNIKGVLFDLGVSSHQLNEVERGFSFNEGLLDMRMDQNLVVKAVDLVNGLHEKELEELFTKYGEEPWAKRIASKIVEVRKDRKIESTTQLQNIIHSVVPRFGSIDQATRVFQALRIAVNDELNNLENVLPLALEILDKGGRIVVISFHSLEDRIVKNTFKNWKEQDRAKVLTDKPIEPSLDEIDQNPRSRSAKMRVCQKI